MKLWLELQYDRKSKDLRYFTRQGFRSGKKAPSENAAPIGKHSALLAIKKVLVTGRLMKIMYAPAARKQPACFR